MNLIYNVTVCVDDDIHIEFIEWIKNEHIPDVLNSKCFLEARLSKINGEEQGGKTYSIMYLAESKEKYYLYQQNFAKLLQEKTLKKFGNKVASFRTILDVIEHFKYE